MAVKMTVNTRVGVTVLSLAVPYGYKDLEQSPEAQPRWPQAKLTLEIVMREEKEEREQEREKSG